MFNQAEHLEGTESIESVSGFMQDIFGDQWWYSIPEKPNSRYQYLCRVILTVQAGLKTMIEGRETVA
ncbi:hypothetical protein [Sansalvadorimonas verongulae]|uniref:hypothetical protein n=1 Tax=Sansalvadorimonas verongulae TaxID=2172824 RepID=UPI0012BBF6B8|nr:hypothetical protein [Sansalvadorimonas verongulae]MTI15209.1 hypothetical protein [Sansalvadorimonas verongulae]